MSDRAIFARLLKEHKDAVYRQAIYLLGNSADAEDVTQEVFLSYWKSREKVETSGARWWLLKVCRNACLDQLRRRQVREKARANPQMVSERGCVGIVVNGDDGRDYSLEVSDLGSDALHTQQRLDIQKIQQQMEQLSEPQRSIILFREVQDMSYEEIAEQLDLSMSQVKVYLHRARKKIRDAFVEEQGVSA